MIQNTPGEWSFRDIGDGFGYVELDGIPSKTLAHTGDESCGSSVEMRLADGRLMAEAKNLLASLRAVLALTRGTTPWILAEFYAARALLARLDGAP